MSPAVKTAYRSSPPDVARRTPLTMDRTSRADTTAEAKVSLVFVTFSFDLPARRPADRVM